METPDFLSTAFHVTTCLELPIHVFGAYCILFKTPGLMNSVKWTMFNVFFSSVMMDFLISFFLGPFIVFPAIAGFPVGVLGFTSVSVPFMAYLMLSVMAAVGIAILLFFESRFSLLFARNHWWQNYRIGFIIANYVAGFTVSIPLLSNIPSQEEAMRDMFEVIPNFPISLLDHPICVLSVGLDYPLLLLIIFTISLVSEVLFFVILLIRSMNKRREDAKISKRTFDLQKKLIRAMHIQVCTPMLIIVGPLNYFAYSIVFSYYNQVVNNFCLIVMTFHGVLSTITMLIIHQPYRDYCISLLSSKVQKKDSEVIGKKRCSSVKLLGKSQSIMSFSYLKSTDFLSKSLHLMTCLEIPVHLFGIYCILFKTPVSMKSVKWIMLNLHIWSVFLDLGVSLMTCPFVLFPAIAGFPLGILKELGIPTSAQIYLIVCLFAIVGVAILGVFENRYYLLYAEIQNSSWRHFRIPFFIGNYLSAVIFFIPPYLQIPEQTQALRKVQEMLPELSYQDIFVLSIDTTYVFFSVAGFVIIAVIECLFFTCSLSYHLRKRVTISEKSTELQRKFLNAMHIQIFTPLIILIIPLIYIGFSVSTAYHNQTLNNFCFIIIALHGLSSTITMLLIHKPYREFCQDVFCVRSLKNSSRTSPVIRSPRVISVTRYIVP